MTDLGLFDRKEDDTGNLDLDELRLALARTAQKPAAATAVTTPRISPRRQQRMQQEAARRRRRRRRRQTGIALIVFVVLAGAITAGLIVWRKKANAMADFVGAAGPPVIVHIGSGASQTDIADALVAAGVVGSTRAFLMATAQDGDVQKLGAGYLRLPTHLPADRIGDVLADPANRVGRIDFLPGHDLADTFKTSGGKTTVIPGYVSQIVQAACVPLVGTVVHCFTAAELWKQIETADLTTQLPSWALDPVKAAPVARKRLEGLIYPGVYDIAPNATAADTLKAVIGASTANWNTSEIVVDARTAGLTPYQAITIGSIVEREAITADMPKVARVVENRIQQRMKLQLDSTVDYALDKAAIATTKTEQKNPSPYNTYVHDGLPPTPISAPGPNALVAAVKPAAGDWLYFVVIDTSGRSCFSVTFSEHITCVDRARKNGVFDQ